MNIFSFVMFCNAMNDAIVQGFIVGFVTMFIAFVLAHTNFIRD